MADEREQQIRERVAKLLAAGPLDPAIDPAANALRYIAASDAADLAYLLAEVDRLRNDVVGMQSIIDLHDSSAHCVAREAALATAREENGRLAAILREQWTGERLACGRYSVPHVDCGECWGCRVRAALAREDEDGR